jgi:succinate dehydrogenase / fumarate reductase, cytochrome b subunit
MAQTLNRGPVSGTAVEPPSKRSKRKPFLVDFYSTAVGKKYVMAITGIIGIAFVIGHMIGNLKMYLGVVTEDGERVYDIDVYGEFLRVFGVPILPHGIFLWMLRLVLIAALVLHVHAAYSLTVLNRKARPVKYQSARDYQVANFASRTMRWTGIIVVLFIAWHLADLTWGWAHPDFVKGAVYYNVDQSLSRLPVAVLYIVANIALGIHLFHGTWSLFQSLGWSNPRFNNWRRYLATGIATVVVVGNVSFPVAVLAGIVDEYGGLLDNRSFGGAQVSRTFYARGQTGQQLLIGAYQQLARQIGLGNVKLWNRMEMVDVVNIDGRCAGIVTRDLMTGEFSSHSAHAVVLATGGYGNVFYLSTNAMACNVTGAWRAHRRGAAFANPCYTQIHPTCIPQADDFQSKLTLMSESLRNDGRIWVPKNADETRSADQIPEADRDYYLERIYPSFGNLAPRDVSSARREAHGRRRPGRGTVEERRLPRLRRRDRAARQGRHRGALRQPVRHVRAHHRREPVRGADADLSRQPLHDGRALGRLRTADHHPRSVLRR